MERSEELYRDIRRVQDEMLERIHALDGVMGSAIGHKVTAGQDTGQPCLVIFVRQKRLLLASDPSILLLRDIHNRGITTDVVERSAVTEPLPPMIIDKAATDSRTDKADPMIGGISCGPDVNMFSSPHAGTLGIVVLRNATGELGVLSNHHVMFYDSATKSVTQPARSDSFFNYPAGDHLTAFKGDVSFGGKSTYVDCAVATVLKNRSATRKTLFGIPAAVTGTVSDRNVRVGDWVIKSGLNGITTGTVKYVSVFGQGGRLPNQFAILGDGGKSFSDAGDSGSVVLIGTKVMGLLWGRAEDDTAKYSMVSPIEAVTQTLDIQI